MAVKDDVQRLYRKSVSKQFTQTKGTRKGMTYRVTRGPSGAAVRVYDPSAAVSPFAKGKVGRATAVIPGTKPATAPDKNSGVGLGALHTAASKAHGGEQWVYRRGVSGKLIPVRKA